MKELFNNKEFSVAKSRESLSLECYNCGQTFCRRKNEIQKVRKGSSNISLKYCTNRCKYKGQYSQQIVQCSNCNKSVSKKANQIKKSTNHFCSRSCSVTYNNSNKTYGIRRSKMEIFLEEKLNSIYNISIEFNRKNTIGSELDIYIPSLKLAFEINGIFHYKPIYGKEKLKSIKANDRKKVRRCKQKNIKLIIINHSKVSNFTKSAGQKYLNKIIKKIDNYT